MKKIKRRGFVMTGGGAKGLYEAGVIQAFHLTGMEFDVITGSSIGAMNSIFYGEYLLRKRRLPPEQRATPEQAIEALDSLIRSYHRAWLLLPEKNLVDDTPQSALGRLVSDLEQFDLSLAGLTRIGWWWTDPKRGLLPGLPVVWAGLGLAKELYERLGSPGQLFRIIKDHRADLVRETLRTYLHRFSLEYALIPEGGKEDQLIADTFTQPVTPLQRGHLSGPVSQELAPVGQAERLVDPARTFKDFAEHDITVQLTRANYRTGRLEMSTYLTEADFMRYMKKQAWRLEVGDPEKMPLGTFRLQLPGNPNVVKAALASGRFPGVFAPFPFQQIYPKDTPENRLLYQLLSAWVQDSQVQASLNQAYHQAFGEAYNEADWQDLLKRWQASQTLRDFFPFETDLYIDGGSIDNTPSNSAVDATRDWIDQHGLGKRDVVLDLYIIYLETEPKISRDQAQAPLLPEVVQRTLAVQSTAVKTGNAPVVKTINSLGNQGEALARTLLSLLAALRQTEGPLDEAQRKALEELVRKIASEQGLEGYLGKNSRDILTRMEAWATQTLQESLPLHVEQIKIYPEAMPLDTLSLTERLGYRKPDAVQMITMGCSNTLWALRSYLEDQGERRDEQDDQALQLARRWMGLETWQKKIQVGSEAFEKLSREWRCTRQACVFHAQACRHGENPQ